MRKPFLCFMICVNIWYASAAQNIGVGTNTPAAKLHIKGAANLTQLIVDAKNTQTNINPLVRLRSSGGTDLLWLHTDHASNIFLGVNAGVANSVSGGAMNNTFIGNDAGTANTSGTNNTANGYRVLFANSTGFNNTGMGVGALLSNTTGNSNTAIGADALETNTSGVSNTAVGSVALLLNTGSYNTAVGYGSMLFSTTGTNNTAMGFQSMNRTTESQYNTAIGFRAGYTFNMGFNNTILGANCDLNQADLFNCVAVGQSVTNTASSQARIGNSATNSIGGYAGWTNISDGRFKKNINENVKGIDFIMKLRPVTYHLDISGISKTLNEGRGKEPDQYTRQAISEKEKIFYSGFIAQEVEKAAQEAGYDFSAVDKPKNDKDLYGLRYAEFVVPLVKAVQEQQQAITGMQKRIALLEEQNKMLLQLLAKKD